MLVVLIVQVHSLSCCFKSAEEKKSLPFCSTLGWTLNINIWLLHLKKSHQLSAAKGKRITPLKPKVCCKVLTQLLATALEERGNSWIRAECDPPLAIHVGGCGVELHGQGCELISACCLPGMDCSQLGLEPRLWHGLAPAAGRDPRAGAAGMFPLGALSARGWERLLPNSTGWNEAHLDRVRDGAGMRCTFTKWGTVR